MPAKAQSPESVVEFARPMHSLSYRLGHDYPSIVMERMSVSDIVPHTSQTPQLSFFALRCRELISFYFSLFLCFERSNPGLHKHRYFSSTTTTAIRHNWERRLGNRPQHDGKHGDHGIVRELH